MKAIPVYALSALLFAGFIANLILTKGGSAILSNAAEMLLMAAAATSFGIGTLISEANAKTDQK